MIETEATAVIEASPSEVYALLADPARFDAASELSGDILSDREMPDGTRAVHARTPMPKGGTVETHTVLTERIPGQRVVFRHSAAPAIALSARLFRVGRTECERTVTLAPHPDGTLVQTRSRWRFKPAPFHLYLARVNRDALRRATETQLKSLRSALVKPPN